jgi:hypothetical protein
MSEEIGEQAIKVLWNTSEVTRESMLALCQKLLSYRKSIRYGKQSLRQLNRHERQLDRVEMADEDIKAFKRELRRYAVDYSLTQDKETGVFQVYFKSQDVERIYAGLERCVANYANNRDKKPMKQRAQEAQRESETREANRQSTREQTRNAERERGVR